MVSDCRNLLCKIDNRLVPMRIGVKSIGAVLVYRMSGDVRADNVPVGGSCCCIDAARANPRRGGGNVPGLRKQAVLNKEDLLRRSLYYLRLGLYWQFAYS